MDDGSLLSVDKDGCHIRVVMPHCEYPIFPPVYMKEVFDLVRDDKLDELQAIVPKYFHVNQGYDGVPMLHAAVHGLKIIDWLTRQPGIALDAVDADGGTALSWAAYNLSIDSMMLLHRRGASLAVVDDLNDSVFHELIRGTLDSNVNRLGACLAFLGDHAPLSLSRARQLLALLMHKDRHKGSRYD
jgi:ankyrin repeat protein